MKTIKNWDLDKIMNEIEVIKESNKFCILDIVTTGFSLIQGDEIIQFAATMYENGEVGEKISLFIKPVKKISNKVTKITGITNEICEMSGFEESTAMFMIKSFIDDAVVVCHNSAFDWKMFISPLFEKYSIKAENKVVCTYKMFNRAEKGLGKGAYTNEKLAEKFGFDIEITNRADLDVAITLQSFIELKQWFDTVDVLEMKKRREMKNREKQKLLSDTPVTVLSVKYWEKNFKGKCIRRHYVNIKDSRGEGSVFFDFNTLKWEVKSFPANINLKSVERDVLSHLQLKNMGDLLSYR